MKAITNIEDLEKEVQKINAERIDLNQKIHDLTKRRVTVQFVRQGLPNLSHYYSEYGDSGSIISKTIKIPEELKKIDDEMDQLNNQIQLLTAKRDSANHAWSALANLIEYYKNYETLPPISSSIKKTHDTSENNILLENGIGKNILLVVDSKIKLFSNSYEIMAILLPIYKKRKGKTKEDIAKFQKQVSNILSIYSKCKQIRSFSPTGSKKDTLWGRNDWFDEDGKPKKEYLK